MQDLLENRNFMKNTVNYCENQILRFYQIKAIAERLRTSNHYHSIEEVHHDIDRILKIAEGGIND